MQTKISLSELRNGNLWKIWFVVATTIIISGCSTSRIFYSDFDSALDFRLPIDLPGLPNTDKFRYSGSSIADIVFWDSLRLPKNSVTRNRAMAISTEEEIPDQPAEIQVFAFPQNTSGYEAPAYTQGKFDINFIAYVEADSYNLRDEFYILLAKFPIFTLQNQWAFSGAIKAKGGELYILNNNGEEAIGVSFVEGEELAFRITLDLDRGTVAYAVSNLGSTPQQSALLEDIPIIGEDRLFRCLAFTHFRPNGISGFASRFIIDQIQIRTARDNVQPD